MISLRMRVRSAGMTSYRRVYVIAADKISRLMVDGQS